ncbi:helix-turn-helix domain-containing protein (plasmid) [Actinomadura sp. ATCC 31491]|uniref:Helix-turn-helix domain-containing protein n=1 Tax=Actinomadura luzonensis TaxID=2805427 RepID=A0ABT0GBM5_9ACTN|nr:helix-turn-helix transcriptional regulator [Actinomadura luzonensis]MCK2222020.1 helix-turn-helix domain-containing protein [Actinomadura luzonensis]
MLEILMAERGPTVRRRRLAGELRRLRERSEMTIDAAAERLGWSTAKVSRIETARTGITAPDLTTMLDLYAVGEDRRVALHALARAARKRGWWDAYADSTPSDYATYIELEAETASMRAFDPLVVNGLLQTEDYAREIIRAALMALSPPAEIQRRVEVRMTRQQLLAQEDSPLNLWTIIPESALQQQVGGREVMAAQYAKLVEESERGNVIIQVLPSAKGAHPATAGQFAIMEFREPYDPQVVYVESMTSSLYVEGEVEIYRYTLAFDHLRAMALDPQESRALILSMARQA